MFNLIYTLIMEIKKFEQLESVKFDIGFNEHIFVLARYKDGWDNFRTNAPFKNDEFVPCMISGSILHQWSKHDFWIMGYTGSWNIDEFEILEGSEKGFQEMIKLYSQAGKYNL